MNRQVFEFISVFVLLASCGGENVSAPLEVEGPAPVVPRIEKAAGLAVLMEDKGEAVADAFFYLGHKDSFYESFPGGLVPSGKCVEGRHNFSLDGPLGSVPSSVGPSVDFRVGSQTLQASTDFDETQDGATIYGLRATGVDARGRFGLSFGQSTSTPFNADVFDMPRAARIDRQSLNDAEAREKPLENLTIRWTPTEGDFVLLTFAKPSSSNFDEVDRRSSPVLTCIARNSGEFSPAYSRALENAFDDYEYVDGRPLRRLFVSVRTFKVGKAVWRTSEPSDSSETYAYDFNVFAAAGVNSPWETLTKVW